MSRKALFRTGLVCLAALLAAVPAPTQTPAFVILLQTDRPAYAFGQRIYLRVFARNSTGVMQYFLPRLMIWDNRGNPLGAPHGNRYETVNSVHDYLYPPTPMMGEVFGFLDPRADLQEWSYNLTSPTAYGIAVFASDASSTRSNVVRVRVFTKTAADSLAGTVLNDPKVDRAIRALLGQYHDVLAKSAGTIAEIPHASHVGNVYNTLARESAWGEDRVTGLSGTGDPTSPYVNVTANFIESVRHLSKIVNIAIAPPPGAFDEPQQPNTPYANLLDRGGLGATKLMPTAPPQTLPPATCDVAQATGELRVAEYFYNAVESEMKRGRARLGDALNPPVVPSAPHKCPW
jgi:hypothetical protein